MRGLLYILALMVAVASCSKEGKEKACLDGTIQWGGDPAADGIGWTFVQSETNQRYFLLELHEAYQQDDLPVSVCLQETDQKAFCNCLQPPNVFAITRIIKQ